MYRGNLGSKSPLKLIPFSMHSLSVFFFKISIPPFCLASLVHSLSNIMKLPYYGIVTPPKNITIEVYIFKYLKTLYLKLIFKHFILHNNKSLNDKWRWSPLKQRMSGIHGQESKGMNEGLIRLIVHSKYSDCSFKIFYVDFKDFIIL